MHPRRKSTLVFAILIGLSSAFAQLSPTHSESIVVFAPHPDDEVIGYAGIIMRALARGARVKVVDITSGDGFDAAAAGLTHKRINQLGPDDFFALSRLRQTQSRNALEILGGKADDLILLGYPDGDLGNLYDSITDDEIIRQPFTKKNETYALIQKEYHTSEHGKPAPYRRSSVLGDLVELLTTLHPTEIYVTDETMATLTIAQRSGLSEMRHNRSDIKALSIPISSTVCPRGLFLRGSRRTGNLNRGRSTAKWPRAVFPGPPETRAAHARADRPEAKVDPGS